MCGGDTDIAIQMAEDILSGPSSFPYIHFEENMKETKSIWNRTQQKVFSLSALHSSKAKGVFTWDICTAFQCCIIFHHNIVQYNSYISLKTNVQGFILIEINLHFYTNEDTPKVKKYLENISVDVWRKITGTHNQHNNIFSKHMVSSPLWIAIKQLREHIYRNV